MDFLALPYIFILPAPLRVLAAAEAAKVRVQLEGGVNVWMDSTTA